MTTRVTTEAISIQASKQETQSTTRTEKKTTAQTVIRKTKYNYAFERTKDQLHDDKYKIWTQTELPYFDNAFSSSYSYSSLSWSSDDEDRINELQEDVRRLKALNAEIIKKQTLDEQARSELLVKITELESEKEKLVSEKEKLEKKEKCDILKSKDSECEKAKKKLLEKVARLEAERGTTERPADADLLQQIAELKEEVEKSHKIIRELKAQSAGNAPDSSRKLSKKLSRFFTIGGSYSAPNYLSGRDDKATMTDTADIETSAEDHSLEECEQIIDQLHRDLKEREIEWENVKEVVAEKDVELTDAINKNKDMQKEIDGSQKEIAKMQAKNESLENIKDKFGPFVPEEERNAIEAEENAKLQQKLEDMKSEEEKKAEEEIKRKEEEARIQEEKRKEQERKAQEEREQIEKELNEFEETRQMLRKQNLETRKWKEAVQSTANQIAELSLKKLRPINTSEVDRLICVRGRSRPIAVYMRAVSSNLSMTGAFIYDTRYLPDNTLYLFVGPECTETLAQKGEKLLQAFILEKPKINVVRIIRTMEGYDFARMMKNMGGNASQIQTAKVAGDEYLFENNFFKTSLHFINFFLGRIETPVIKGVSFDALPSKGASIIDTSDLALYLYMPNLIPVDEQEKQDREAAIKWMAEQHEFEGRDVTVFNKNCVPPNLQVLFEI